jgi:hypothetical protein
VLIIFDLGGLTRCLQLSILAGCDLIAITEAEGDFTL